MLVPISKPGDVGVSNVGLVDEDISGKGMVIEDSLSVPLVEDDAGNAVIEDTSTIVLDPLVLELSTELGTA